MSSHQLLRRYWESTRNGNCWYYLAEVKHDYAAKSQVRQLGSVQRIVNTDSPNFNKWLTYIAYEENQWFFKKADAMAYVVTLVGLRQ